MLTALRNKIEKKRNSKKLFWRGLFAGRDLLKSIEKSKGRLFRQIDFTDLSLCKPVGKYAFVFVCQEGRLEIGSLLLAASLKRFLKCDYELIAAIPLPIKIMGKPKEVTVELLKKMDVRTVNIHNKIVSEKQRQNIHLIANKMYCLRIPTTADKLIFLDSDFLCLKEFYGDARFAIPFNARMVGYAGTRHYEGKWYKFYKSLKTEMPGIRIRVEQNNLFNYVPPCFNSGFIGIKTNLAHKLCDCWFECWKKLDDNGLVKDHPYHIDQIALAVAICKVKIPYEIIDRSWIYRYFFIYHELSMLKNNREMIKLVQSLIQEYPEILSLIENDSEWQFLLNY